MAGSILSIVLFLLLSRQDFGTHLSNKLATEREIQLNGLSTLSQLRSKQGFTHQILFGDLNSKKSDVEVLTRRSRCQLEVLSKRMIIYITKETN